MRQRPPATGTSKQPEQRNDLRWISWFSRAHGPEHLNYFTLWLHFKRYRTPTREIASFSCYHCTMAMVLRCIWSWFLDLLLCYLARASLENDWTRVTCCEVDLDLTSRESVALAEVLMIGCAGAGEGRKGQAHCTGLSRCTSTLTCWCVAHSFCC